MAIGIRSKKIKTIKDLRAFINDLPDGMKVLSIWLEPVKAIIWEKEKGEPGPTRYLSIEEID